MAYDQLSGSSMGRQDIAVIGDASMALGFRLAGIRNYSVIEPADQKSFEAELTKMLGSEKISMIIAPQTLLAHASQSLTKRMASQLLPIVVGVPEKEGGGETSDMLRQLLKRVLGIEVKVTG